MPKLLAYAEDLTTVAAACEGSTASALRAIRAQVGLGETMDVLDASRPALDRSTHADDLTALESVAAFHPEVASFEPWLRRVLQQPVAEGPAVLLSTVHRIKGREWDRVVVFGATQGLLPHRLAENVEGERRVCHVALTRARREVVLLADAEAPSRFLAELAGDAVPVPAPAAGRPTDGSRVRTGPGRTRGDPAGPGPGRGGGSWRRPCARWRSSVARREEIPAFLVLSDKDLGGIAEATPRRLARPGPLSGHRAQQARALG